MYRSQLNFAVFCGTSTLSISWQHLNHPNLLVRSVYRFYLYFHVRIILHHLGISLPHEDGFRMVENSYIKSAYYSICDDYGVNADGTWINVLYNNYGVLGDGGKTQKDLHQTTLHDR